MAWLPRPPGSIRGLRIRAASEFPSTLSVTPVRIVGHDEKLHIHNAHLALAEALSGTTGLPSQLVSTSKGLTRFPLPRATRALD